MSQEEENKQTGLDWAMADDSDDEDYSDEDEDYDETAAPSQGDIDSLQKGGLQNKS